MGELKMRKMLGLETVREGGLFHPLSCSPSLTLRRLTDEKDGGPLILTNIYLLAGMSLLLSLWGLSPVPPIAAIYSMHLMFKLPFLIVTSKQTAAYRKSSAWGEFKNLSCETIHFGDQPLKGSLNMERSFSYLFQRDKEIEVELENYLQQGHSVDKKDSDGKALLYYGSVYGLQSIVRYLLDRGADIHQKDREGNTALHWAARYGKTDVVRLLIECGANFEEQNKVMETPAYLAAWNLHSETLNFLLQLGKYILSNI